MLNINNQKISTLQELRAYLAKLEAMTPGSQLFDELKSKYQDGDIYAFLRQIGEDDLAKKVSEIATGNSDTEIVTALRAVILPSKLSVQAGKDSLSNKDYEGAELLFKTGGHYYWLGLMEYEGLGRKKSYRKAYEIFSKHNNDSLCNFMTALMLFKGEGVLKNDDNALRIIDGIRAANVNDTSPRRAQKIKDVINGIADDATIKEVYSTEFYKF